MNITAHQCVGHALHEFTLVASAEEFEQAVEQVYQKHKSEYTLAGYPAGQAPRAAIEAEKGDSHFYYHAVNTLLAGEADALLAQAMASHGLTALTPPAFDLTMCSFKGFTMKMTVAVLPEVTLGQYQGLTFVYPRVQYPADAVENHLQMMRQRAADQAGEGAPLPALDDTFARTMCGCESIDALRAQIAQSFEQHIVQQSRKQGTFMLLEEIGNGCTMQLPEALLEAEFNNSLANMKAHLAQHGISMEQYLAQAGKTMPQLEDEHRLGARRALRGKLAAYTIAKKEGITVTPVEIESELVRLSAVHGKSVAEFKAETAPYMIENELLLYRTIRFLAEHSTLIEETPERPYQAPEQAEE